VKKSHLILLGVAAYLLTLLVLFPASPVVASINTQPLQVLGVSGSLWSGRATRVQAPNAPPLDSLNWSFRPLALFTGALGADLDFKLLGGQGEAKVAQSFAGSTRIDSASLRFPAKQLEAWLPLPIASFNGAIELDLAAAVIAAQGLEHLEGQLRWRQAKLETPVSADLGEILLDIAPAEDGAHSGELTSEGGELELRGRINIDVAGRLRVDINIKPRDNASAELRDSLSLLGRPRGDGSYRIRQQMRLSDLM